MEWRIKTRIEEKMGDAKEARGVIDLSISLETERMEKKEKKKKEEKGARMLRRMVDSLCMCICVYVYG